MSSRAGAPATIDARQVALIVALLVGGTAFLSLPRLVTLPAGPAGWLGVALGAVLAYLAGWSLLALYTRHPGLTLVGAARQVAGPFLGNLVGLGLVAWGHFYLAVLVREFAGVFLVPFMPETPLSAFLVVTTALLIYAAYQGVEVIVRTAQIFLPFILLSLVLIVAGLLPRFNPGHLKPLAGYGWPGVGEAALFTLSTFGQSVAATAFFPLLRRPAETRPALWWGYGLAAGAFLLLTVMELGAFSAPILTQLAFPSLSAARLVRIGLFFERFEAAFMVIWFVLSFLKLALFFFFTTATLAEVLGLPEHKPLVFPGGLLVAFTAFFPDNFVVMMQLVGDLYRYGFLAFALPVLLLLGSLGRRRPLLLVLLLGLALGAGGCWSRRELEDTAFVLALGFAQTRPGQVRVTLQSALPSRLSGGAKGEGGGGGAGSGETGPVWVATAEGPTVFAAVRELEKRASDRLFLAHARVLLFSEQAAREGIGPVLDYALREPQIRETVTLLVTPDSPEEVLKTIPSQEKIPVFYLNNLLEHARLHGTSAPLDLLSYQIYTSFPGAAVALPRLFLYRPPAKPGGDYLGGGAPGGQPTDFTLDGLAILRQGRLVGYLPPEAVPGLLWVTGRVRGLPVTFSDPRQPQTRLSVEVLYATCRTRLTPDLERPERTRIRLDVRGEANLREIAGKHGGGGQESDVHTLERALSQEVAHQIWRSLTVARHYQADVFGLGENAREVLTTRQWAAFAPRWPEAFARCPVDVRADLRLRRRGMTF